MEYSKEYYLDKIKSKLPRYRIVEKVFADRTLYVIEQRYTIEEEGSFWCAAKTYLKWKTMQYWDKEISWETNAEFDTLDKAKNILKERLEEDFKEIAKETLMDVNVLNINITVSITVKNLSDEPIEIKLK